jgi:hypothetical protein
MIDSGHREEADPAPRLPADQHAGNVAITQLVDKPNLGVHVRLPKSIFTGRPAEIAMGAPRVDRVARRAPAGLPRAPGGPAPAAPGSAPATAASAAAEPARVAVTADDGFQITMWRKAPAQPRRSVLLVHGRTWSGRPDFDLQVPGESRSFMDALVAQGFAAYAIDLRGYGATPRDATGFNTPERAAADVAAALRTIGGRPVVSAGRAARWSRTSRASGLRS